MKKSLRIHNIALRGLLLLCGMLGSTYLFAQSVTITGKVSSEKDGPVIGVNIREKGTGKGAATNQDGVFSINISKPDAVLVFSYVGFVSQEVKVSGTASLSIVLKADNQNLQELVVTALGIRKEAKRIGYSTQEIKGSELTKAREPNAINSLTGKIAGLTVGSSAEMLGRPQLVLRGSTDLLFVVDGVPVNSDTWNVNGDDVESYTVLKGANAAALYGFRGQNGAILITTKKGTKDKRGFTVDFNSSTMIEKGFIAMPKAQTQYGYGTAYTYDYGSGLYSTSSTAGSGSYRANIWGPLFDGQMVRQYDSPYDPATGIRGKSPWTARGKDNFKKFMEAGLLSTNNISMASSGSNYDMRLSYSHSYQKGMAPNTKLNMDNLSVNAAYNISSKLRAEGSLNLNVQYTPNIPDVSYGPNSYPYMFQVYGSANWSVDDMKDYYKSPANNPLGKQGLQQYYAEYGRENNPYFVANEWLHGHYKTDVNGYAKVSYAFNDHLNLSARTQVTTWSQTRSEKAPASLVLNSYLAPAGSPFTSWAGNPNAYTPSSYTGDYREDQRKVIENNTDVLLTYNKQLRNFSLSALAGASERSYKYNSNWSSTNWLLIPGVYTLSNSKDAVKSYSWASNMQVYSAYYTFDLGYKNYINVSTTGRMDNLSTLPSGNKTFFYPSVAVSSVISDYTTLPGAISFLKVRASYADVKGGLTNSTIGSAYMASTGFSKTVNTGLLGYGSELYSSYDGPSYQNQASYAVTTYYNGTPSVSYSNTIPNKNIKPFNVKSLEGGLDVKFLKNRLGLEATYFRTENGPSITPLPIASSTGYTAQLQNAITSLKKGYEISLTGAPIRNPNGFSWDVMMNFSTYKETLKNIYQGESQITINNHNYKIGDRLDGYYGLKYQRSPDGQIIHAGGIVLAPKTGNDNLQLLGHLNPDFVFGINNRFAYKAFSMSFQVDGRVGGVIYDEVWSRQMNSGTAMETVQGAYGVARLKDGQAASANGGSLPAGYAGSYVGKGVVIASGTPVYDHGVITNQKDLTYAPNTVATTVQNYVSNGIYAANIDEAFLIKRTYVKLREVTLNYTVPSQVLSHSFFRAASVSLVGRNLLYFAARKDMDLDQYANGFNLTDKSTTGVRGLSSDLQSTTARRYGVNINLGF